MEDDEASETTPWLDTVEGEIVFFRASMRARPVGIHRFFHVVCIMDQIRRQTGREVDGDDIWEKFRSMYDLDALEGLETEGYSSSESDGRDPASPSPSEDLSNHPHFRSEFSLFSLDPDIHNELEPLIIERRNHAANSPSSATDVPPIPKRRKNLTGNGKGARNTRSASIGMAGLVSGKSDSSALTDSEISDEAPSERAPVRAKRSASVATAATQRTVEIAEEEDVEMASPAPSSVSRRSQPVTRRSPKKPPATRTNRNASGGGGTKTVKARRKSGK